MKKNNLCLIPRHLLILIEKIPNAMKLTFLFLVISLLTFTAEASAQRVSMSLNNVKVEKVLSAITKQTGLSVAYSKQIVNLDRKVSIQVENADVTSVLEKLVANTNLNYEIKNNKIYLFEKQTVPTKPAIQQKKQISGKIVDQNGEPVIGANIYVKGTTNGTMTDLDGNFSLSVPETGTLLISYIGFLSQNIDIKGQANFLIVLKEDTQSLDEVVVVGYGVQKKRDLTGAISSVKMTNTPVGTISTVSHALAGKAAGLQVFQNSAQVGGGATFRIRGATSINAGNDPLFIIDGFPISTSSTLDSDRNYYKTGTVDNILASINPNDIESIEVLKDASATAIYGSRAGHGVIIITTKRGKSGAPKVTYSGNVTVQNVKNNYKMLDAKEYMTQRNRFVYET